jgi:hypothetical protein
MVSIKGLTMTAAAAAVLLGSAPAAAQYQRDRGRTGRVADEIVRQVETAVDAIDRVNNAVDGVRFSRAERFAVSRCAPRAEQYGEMRVDRVVPYGNRSLRVYGTAGATGRYDRYDRYGRSDRYSRGGYGARSFTCTVREDGRVKFKTRRLRY